MDVKKSNKKNTELDSKLIISGATLFLIVMYLYEDKVTKFIRIASKLSWVALILIVMVLLIDSCSNNKTKEKTQSKSGAKKMFSK